MRGEERQLEQLVGQQDGGVDAEAEDVLAELGEEGGGPAFPPLLPVLGLHGLHTALDEIGQVLLGRLRLHEDQVSDNQLRPVVAHRSQRRLIPGQDGQHAGEVRVGLEGGGGGGQVLHRLLVVAYERDEVVHRRRVRG